MKKTYCKNRFSNLARSVASGFTLIELLVVISIIGVLAALSLTAMQRVRRVAAETKSTAVLRSTLQACIAYSAENNGEINTLRYTGDPCEGPSYVTGSFWGRLQPYIFPAIKTTSQSQLSSAILTEMKRVFGCADMNTMAGTPFGGTKRYGDGSGLPVPFAFNKYINEWGKWVTQLNVDSMSSTTYFTYGFACFDEEDVKEYVPMPTDGKRPVNNVYYLSSQKAIMGFLDGHVANVAPPIKATMVTLDDQVQ